MSMLRAARTFRPPRTLTLAGQRRLASSSEHHHDEHHSAGDAHYPPEGFSGSIWMKTFVVGGLIFGVANFAPAGFLAKADSGDSDDAPWLTRVLDYYRTHKETWQQINEKHLAQSADVSDYNLVVQDARRPNIHRYRSPTMFDQVSPHCNPIGGGPDLSNLVIKGDQS